MKRCIITIIALVLFLIPINSYAVSKNYVDHAAKTLNIKVEKDKVNLYLFYGKECPHCEEEREWLKQIKIDYKKYLNVYEYEVWHNDKNKAKMEEIKSIVGEEKSGVPFTVIGDTEYVGYSEALSSILEEKIK